jgi:hypothetical protein
MQKVSGRFDPAGLPERGVWMGSTASLDSRAMSGTAAAIAFARLPCGATPADLQADTAFLLRQSWVGHVNRRDYQGDWNILPLRCPREHADAHPILQGFAIQGNDEWQDLPLLQECPAIRALLKTLNCPLKSVRLMRLCAGAFIRPHRDQGLALEYGEARLHLPIHTSSDVRFVVDGRRVPMRAGELWYINTDREHEVRNPGKSDRINLVIDCLVNDWLRAQVYSADILSYCREDLQ